MNSFDQAMIDNPVFQPSRIFAMVSKTGPFGIAFGAITSVWGFFSAAITPDKLVPWATGIAGVAVVLFNAGLLVWNKYEQVRRTDAEQDVISESKRIQLQAIARQNANDVTNGKPPTFPEFFPKPPGGGGEGGK